MELNIEGATIEAGGEKKIRTALAVLAKDPHAPREISLKFTLHVHHEYPKHVGGKIVHNQTEERAAFAAAAEKTHDLAPE